MNTPLSMPRRWVYVLLLLAVVLCVAFPLLQRSPWHKHRLYSKLISGNPEQQLMAASALVYFGGQDQLLLALQSENTATRDIAQRALEHLWFTSSGNEAYELIQKAYRLAESDQPEEALTVLQEVIRKHPGYAEAYNRRASVYWRMGETKKSMEDSERAVTLNPAHYGAWQGLAMGHRQKGNFSAACRCLRMALKLIPHDPATREALRKCEEASRTYPLPSKQAGSCDWT